MQTHPATRTGIATEASERRIKSAIDLTVIMLIGLAVGVFLWQLDQLGSDGMLRALRSAAHGTAERLVDLVRSFA